MASPKLTIVNVLICGAALLANYYLQIFCRPVLWAWITLILCIVPVIFFPWIKERAKPFRLPLFFLFGIAACICLYCILFLGKMILISPLAVLINPITVLGYLPIFLLVQIIYHTCTSANSFKPFLSGILLCIAFAIGMATWFHRSFDRVYDALNEPEKASLIPPNYMTELMLGMHFKYHISFCGYDGWRPPLHDPSIVVAAWLNVPFHQDAYRAQYHYDYLCGAPIFMGTPMDGKNRFVVYKHVFPNNAIWQQCSCAKAYSKLYFEDSRRMK